MSNAEHAENNPPRPSPEGESRKRLDVVLAYVDGNAYAIPMDVARQFRSGDGHDQQAGEEEVGGRDLRMVGNNRYAYHSNWANGPYVWITDGRSYRGPHWHPNPNSPLAYDMDNY